MNFISPKNVISGKILTRRIEEFKEINFVLSTENIKDLKKNKKDNSFIFKGGFKTISLLKQKIQKIQRKTFPRATIL